MLNVSEKKGMEQARIRSLFQTGSDEKGKNFSVFTMSVPWMCLIPAQPAGKKSESLFK